MSKSKNKDFREDLSNAICQLNQDALNYLLVRMADEVNQMTHWCKSHEIPFSDQKLLSMENSGYVRGMNAMFEIYKDMLRDKLSELNDKFD